MSAPISCSGYSTSGYAVPPSTSPSRRSAGAWRRPRPAPPSGGRRTPTRGAGGRASRSRCRSARGAGVRPRPAPRAGGPPRRRRGRRSGSPPRRPSAGPRRPRSGARRRAGRPRRPRRGARPRDRRGVDRDPGRDRVLDRLQPGVGGGDGDQQVPSRDEPQQAVHVRARGCTRGSTASDTCPSRPFVSSHSGRRTSHASWASAARSRSSASLGGMSPCRPRGRASARASRGPTSRRRSRARATGDRARRRGRCSAGSLRARAAARIRRAVAGASGACATVGVARGARTGAIAGVGQRPAGARRTGEIAGATDSHRRDRWRRSNDVPPPPSTLPAGRPLWPRPGRPPGRAPPDWGPSPAARRRAGDGMLRAHRRPRQARIARTLGPAGPRFYVGRVERSQPAVFVVGEAVRRLEPRGRSGGAAPERSGRRLAAGLLRDATGRRPRPSTSGASRDEVVARLPGTASCSPPTSCSTGSAA